MILMIVYLLSFFDLRFWTCGLVCGLRFGLREAPFCSRIAICDLIGGLWLARVQSQATLCLRIAETRVLRIRALNYLILEIGNVGIPPFAILHNGIRLPLFTHMRILTA